jgi:hypothetical protein
MSSQRCSHGRVAPTETLENLHDSQAGTGRHKCAVCAYDSGYRWGLEHPAPEGGQSEECQQHVRVAKDILDGLPDSQAGAGRHKCVNCAYREGFDRARAQAGLRDSS